MTGILDGSALGVSEPNTRMRPMTMGTINAPRDCVLVCYSRRAIKDQHEELGLTMNPTHIMVMTRTLITR